MSAVGQTAGAAAAPRTVRTTHDVTAEAPADAVYRILATARDWPAVFEPTVFVDVLETGAAAGQASFERFRLWATVNGRVVNWSSRRELDPVARLISFRQEHSTPPIASMAGSWHVEDLGGGRSRITLVHDFATVDGSRKSEEWITAALDTNSGRELGQLAALAEAESRHAGGGRLVETFEDAFELDVAPEAVFEFIDRGDLWEQRLPHVSRSRLTVGDDGAQRLVMTTVTPDGSEHETSSVRVRVDGGRLAYKQDKPPALLTGHAGLWTFAPLAGGRTLATSRHTFTLRPEAVEQVLGAGTTVEAAMRHMREALGANSRATLEHAAAFAAK